MPPPPVTFDLESGVRVTCDINCIWLGLVLLALLRLVGLFAEYLTSSIFGNHCSVVIHIRQVSPHSTLSTLCTIITLFS